MPWPTANTTGNPLFTDLKDLRPTFYGFVVAYKLLGERKYLDAAVRGADWFVRNAVDKGAFTGVCGDARFINDFATGQAAQALLDMHGLTGETRYRDAALRTAPDVRHVDLHASDAGKP